VAGVVYSLRAQRTLERIFDFYAEHDVVLAGRVLDVIHQAITVSRHHPHIGRPAEEGLFELIISYGKTGFVALYDYDPEAPSAQGSAADPLQPPGRVYVRAIRHQREAGY
jgi:plasmid stabilization system protein ParE